MAEQRQTENAYSCECSLSGIKINGNKRAPGPEERHGQDLCVSSFQKATAAEHSTDSRCFGFMQRPAEANGSSRSACDGEKMKYSCPRFQTCEYINNG